VALETEFQEFVALALGVVDRKISLSLSIRRADYVGWLENTALKFACESKYNC
jgi:hypothetical protein